MLWYQTKVTQWNVWGKGALEILASFFALGLNIQVGRPNKNIEAALRGHTTRRRNRPDFHTVQHSERFFAKGWRVERQFAKNAIQWIRSIVPSAKNIESVYPRRRSSFLTPYSKRAEEISGRPFAPITAQYVGRARIICHISRPRWLNKSRLKAF